MGGRFWNTYEASAARPMKGLAGLAKQARRWAADDKIAESPANPKGERCGHQNEQDGADNAKGHGATPRVEALGGAAVSLQRHNYGLIPTSRTFIRCCSPSVSTMCSSVGLSQVTSASQAVQLR